MKATREFYDKNIHRCLEELGLLYRAPKQIDFVAVATWMDEMFEEEMGESDEA